MTALFVGVDGGGTSTRCVVAGETGEVAGRGRSGGANVLSAPDPAASLLAALTAALEGLNRSRVAGGVFGLAGVARGEAPAVQAWRAAGLPGLPVVVPDVLVAFCGATPEPDGTVLVSGTGAMAARIRDRAVVRRADGLGWLLGDEGSGVWIGRHALTRALTALDGRTPPTLLVDLVAAAVLGRAAPAHEPTPEWSRELTARLIDVVYERVASKGAAWLGTLSPVVDDAARKGDPVAGDILDEAAHRLSRTAKVAGRDPERDEDDGDDFGGPLVLAGSLLTEPTELARRVRAALGERAPWTPARDGAVGAAALALRAALPADRAHEAHVRLIERVPVPEGR
ncbi:BadF/BadG/BcrA/BcrD ATPase family protein [Planotetraspora phitsanulokensis]|uniref:N-acetylglucosamine kinase n=1 Tax=Planotetraspora phitsanulokensis TaxID=575192 RepID=A0A8J3XDS3_9ACTN|nr:BadF/BadG/BcrA/BcrD ATPase family protein [Planotetraspora phitsanulokensis]GII36919.1 N-acetylglucosamine kinase [Planotetraspora phitsanulokensis]